MKTPGGVLPLTILIVVGRSSVKLEESSPASVPNARGRLRPVGKSGSNSERRAEVDDTWAYETAKREKEGAK